MARAAVLLLPLLATLRGAEPATGFLGSLTAEERARLGLARLTLAQAEGLNAAVEAYARRPGARADGSGRPTSVAPPAAGSVPLGPPPPVAAGEAAPRKDETPGAFRARVAGVFRGWSGGTYFPLTNGQVWRQVGSESHELPPREDAEVEIYPSRSGYWRLRFDGAWITVRRLQ